MAITPAGNRLTEAHRQAQVRLSARTLLAFLPVWATLDMNALDRTYPAYARLFAMLVNAQRGQASRLAGEYLQAFRSAEGVYDLPFEVLPAEPLPAQAIETSARVSGPVAVKTGMRAGKTVQAAGLAASGLAASSVIRHVSDAARSTVNRTVLGDSKAHGVARVTDAKACAFCAMLASRGPVYKSKMTADFKSHYKCGCHSEPVYSLSAYTWPGGERSKRYAELYAAEAKGKRDPLNAFRRAYEQSQL